MRDKPRASSKLPKPVGRLLDAKGKVLWNRSLPNDVAPAMVLIANSGRFVATFDEWYGTSSASNTVVLYGAKGELIGSWALSDLLDGSEIALLPRTFHGFTLTNGNEPPHYFAEKANRLVLVIPQEGPGHEAGGQAPKIERYIDLVSGKVSRSL